MLQSEILLWPVVLLLSLNCAWKVTGENIDSLVKCCQMLFGLSLLKWGPSHWVQFVGKQLGPLYFSGSLVMVHSPDSFCVCAFKFNCVCMCVYRLSAAAVSSVAQGVFSGSSPVCLPVQLKQCLPTGLLSGLIERLHREGLIESRSHRLNYTEGDSDTQAHRHTLT